MSLQLKAGDILTIPRHIRWWERVIIWFKPELRARYETSYYRVISSSTAPGAVNYMDEITAEEAIAATGLSKEGA